MNHLRKDFPFFSHHQLIYADNAATTHKPQAVIDAMVHYYTQQNAPVHRGIYDLAEEATIAYEAARNSVAGFINAQNSTEIAFTRNTTEGINLIAHAWSHNLQAGDEIILTELEHHANLAPWQRLAAQKGLKLRFIPVNPDLTLNLESLDAIFSSRAKLVAISPISNVAAPLCHEVLHKLTEKAKRVGAKILLDAAQMAGHETIDVKALGCDFLVFSGHKMYGPTGIGVVYVKENLHSQLQPYQVGGGMISSVSYDKTSWLPMPHMLEAGSPAVAQALGLQAAIEYLAKIDKKALKSHENGLISHFLAGIQQIPAIKLLGNPQQLKQGHLSCFYAETMHAHDIAAFLAQEGIAVRAGHHCCQPLHAKLGITSSVRVSFGAYNTLEEVDVILQALRKLDLKNA